MRVERTALPGVLLIRPTVHRDGRGWFQETWSAKRYAEHGIPAEFAQDNASSSAKGTLRGLHAQRTKPQGKLVRVVAGEIFDVAVDVRAGSPTFLRWVGVTLSAADATQCWIPPGFAHGFCVLGDRAEVEYKCTEPYDPADELRIRWDDPEIGVRWPISDPVLSPADAAAVSMAAARLLLAPTLPRT
jgi:dTDP-4-dehydrorhamnose 3,5-epimerase